MEHGTVAWFDRERGVGAITPDDGSTELAVHYTQIDGGGRQSLRVNDRVTFSVLGGPSDRRVANVYVP